MPTYSYKCTECGHAFDVQQSFSDSSLTECPVCGGRLRKVFNAIGVTFNGSGFYRTDSRSSTTTGSGGSSSSSSSGDSGSGGAAKVKTSTSDTGSASSAGSTSAGS